jgi:hypothetical protein
LTKKPNNDFIRKKPNEISSFYARYAMQKVKQVFATCKNEASDGMPKLTSLLHYQRYLLHFTHVILWTYFGLTNGQV